MSTIALIVARCDNGVIGDHGGIPWRIPEDLRHFRQLTLGKPCIMGRKTWASLPLKPLPGRTNIIVTRDRAFSADGAIIAFSMDDAIRRAQADAPPEVMVIGGSEIYRAALPLAERVYLTEIHGKFSGDTHLGPFSEDTWQEAGRRDCTGADGLGFSFVSLTRRNSPRAGRH